MVVIIYFIIKLAVKNGINESMLEKKSQKFTIKESIIVSITLIISGILILTIHHELLIVTIWFVISGLILLGTSLIDKIKKK